MSKVATTQTVSNTEGLEDLKRYVSIQIDDILSEINGRLTFADNLRTRVLNIAFKSADALEVPHSLGAVPNGYILIGSDLPVQLSDGGASTTTSIILKATGTTYPINARVMIF